MQPTLVPETVFHTRVRSESGDTAGSFDWRQVSTGEIFTGRNVVLFAVPGAFTPACSETHLPGFESAYDEFRELGIDDVICLSVNDSFVMNKWAASLDIRRVRMLPDGNGAFSEGMGMLVTRTAQGMGNRSWRYSMHVTNGEVRKTFAEPGLRDNPPGVPVQISDAATMLGYLRDL